MYTPRSARTYSVESSTLAGQHHSIDAICMMPIKIVFFYKMGWTNTKMCPINAEIQMCLSSLMCGLRYGGALSF